MSPSLIQEATCTSDEYEYNTVWIQFLDELIKNRKVGKNNRASNEDGTPLEAFKICRQTR